MTLFGRHFVILIKKMFFTDCFYILRKFKMLIFRQTTLLVTLKIKKIYIFFYKFDEIFSSNCVKDHTSNNQDCLLIKPRNLGLDRIFQRRVCI